MTQFKLLTTSILFAVTIMAFEKGYSQSNLSAIVSQEGVCNYKITKGGFYLYISQGGQITGFGALGNGSITYDYKGRVDKIGSINVTYDYKGRIDGLGSTSITYDYKGRVDKVGSTDITYDYKERIDKISSFNVTYDYKGRVDKIGSSTITYDYKDRVDKINDDDGIIIFRPNMPSDE